MMRTVSATAILVLLLALTASTALADPPRTPGGSLAPRPDRPAAEVETTVVTSESGVIIYLGIRETTPGAPGAPGSGDLIGDLPVPSCSATATHLSESSDWAREGAAAHPDAIAWGVTCDDGYFGIAWVPVDAPGDPTVIVESLPAAPTDPLAVAQSLLGLIPLPPITIGANPETGLVALPSWFWVEGYGGEALRGAETLGGTTVEVEITPQRYDWDFGDGTRLTTTSLGQPYPAESDVQHTYEQSSLTAGGAFQVRLAITFAATYRVSTEGDGGVTVGDWQPAGEIVHAFERAHPVQQLQSVLAAGE